MSIRSDFREKMQKYYSSTLMILMGVELGW